MVRLIGLVLLPMVFVAVLAVPQPQAIKWTELDAAYDGASHNKLQHIADYEQQWQDFKSKFGKKYSSDEEETTKKQIFFESIKEVEMHNYLEANGKSSFRLGINQFSDMKSEEVSALMTGYRDSNQSEFKSLLSEYLSPASPVQLPSSVDWRKQGYVTPVKNQGSCGSCWAFSIVGAIEGQNYRKTKKLVSLSEQNLVDCSTSNHGCNGGFTYKAINDLVRLQNGGINAEQCYPYTAKQGYCRFKSSCIGAKITGGKMLPPGNETKLKEAVAMVGPIAVSIDATLPSFQRYTSGVYDDPNCSSMLGHAVLAVGYGTERGKDYWLIKNSWGSTWGDQGYIKMSRNNRNQCGIATRCVYPTV